LKSTAEPSLDNAMKAFRVQAPRPVRTSSIIRYR
jgi:hypothetical protein